MKFKKIVALTKRQKFVLSVLFLAGLLFITGFFGQIQLIALALGLSLLTTGLLYLILREDVKGTFYYPIFILPFLYSFGFALFYSVLPDRLLSRFLITIIYAFGIYSLFLTENIFAVSSIRTINLLRSARIVSFIITIIVYFFLVNIAFSLRLPFFVTPFIVMIFSFLLNYQSLWSYSLDKNTLKDIVRHSLFVSLALFELAFVLTIWPVSAAIYGIFLTGIFYMYSGLSHAWIDKRLFKGVLWEYIWIGVLSILILFVFAEWGI